MREKKKVIEERRFWKDFYNGYKNINVYIVLVLFCYILM